MVGCLVVGHGNVAQAMVDACNQIAGTRDGIYTLSCDEVSPKQLHSEITALIESEDLHDGLFILVGLHGGSYWNAAVRVSREYPNVEVLSGLNLSMLLSFITKREKHSVPELAELLEHDGIRAIRRARS